jgi:hypothetical protein
MLLWGVDKMRRHKVLPEAWQEAAVGATMRSLHAACGPAAADAAAAATAAVAALAAAPGASDSFAPHERRRPAPLAFAPAELPSVLYYMLRIKAQPPPEWISLYMQVRRMGWGCAGVPRMACAQANMHILALKQQHAGGRLP